MLGRRSRDSSGDWRARALRAERHVADLEAALRAYSESSARWVEVADEWRIEADRSDRIAATRLSAIEEQRATILDLQKQVENWQGEYGRLNALRRMARRGAPVLRDPADDDG